MICLVFHIYIYIYIIQFVISTDSWDNLHNLDPDGMAEGPTIWSAPWLDCLPGVRPTSLESCVSDWAHAETLVNPPAHWWIEGLQSLHVCRLQVCMYIYIYTHYYVNVLRIL